MVCAVEVAWKANYRGLVMLKIDVEHARLEVEQ